MSSLSHSEYWQSIREEIGKKLVAGIEKLKAIKINTFGPYYFQGDSGAWYSLGWIDMSRVVDTPCIKELKTLKQMPKDWAPPIDRSDLV